MNDVFITENFLLSTDQAVRLFHEYARDLPIIDYHCHLSPQQVAEDHQFKNMAEVWLYGDHYKWRLMRTLGVSEDEITGDVDDWRRFATFAEAVPHTLRNPMYHWVHMELKTPFGISDRLFNAETAKGIWDHCNKLLATPEFSARGIMKQMKVALVCTTDDPTDTLEHHKTVRDDASFDIQMLPAYRPDKGMAVESAVRFNAWVDKLAAAADVDIKNFASYLDAFRARHKFFHEMGCRLSDHGIETVYAADYTDGEITAIFDKIRSGGQLDADEILKFKSAMLYEFALMDHEKGWTQQIHYGAIRNNNPRMFEKLGPDTGYDSVGDFQIGMPLSKLLGRLDASDQLAKTILYNLNPRDNELLASMLGNFQGPGVRGKIQFGSSWWFLDNIEYMTRQMDALSNAGLLSCFVGMLTDSRSFLSYTRHEYFRRLLCDILGREMAAGLLPNDMDLLGKMVADISYHNAANYFGFDLPNLG